MIDYAVLKYHREADGEEFETKATRIEGAGLRFELVHEEKGVLVLDSVRCIKEDSENVIYFSEIGIEAKYGVDIEAETCPDAMIVDESEDVSMEVVSFDENGNQTSDLSIEEAISDQNIQSKQRMAMARSVSASNTVVVVLDPRHDNVHSGAQGIVKEEELTLKIAQYCKSELEEYAGAKVFMTRSDDGSCPYPGTTSVNCGYNIINI